MIHISIFYLNASALTAKHEMCWLLPSEHGDSAWGTAGERAHQRSVEDVPAEKGGDEG